MYNYYIIRNTKYTYDSISCSVLYHVAPLISSDGGLEVDFRNFIVFSWAETLAHWNPTSCQKKSTMNLFGFETVKIKIRR